MPESKKSNSKAIVEPQQSSNVVSNSLRLKSPRGIKSKQNISNILGRLPFLRELNRESRDHLLMSVAPIWQQWLNDSDNKNIKKFSMLTSVTENTIHIHCTQSTAATLLKHQTKGLLEQVHNSGLESIKTIKVQMQLNSNQSKLNSVSKQEKKALSIKVPQDKYRQKPSTSAIKSLEATQSIVKNKELASSLKRLAKTLKRAT